MKQKQIFFLILVGIAMFGIGTIVLALRPKSAVAGNTKTISYQLAGQNYSLTLRQVANDTSAGARFIQGSSNAKNTVVEFSDYQCPAYGVFATQFETVFKTQFVDSGKVCFMYRDYPLPQHQSARLTAQAAAC